MIAVRVFLQVASLCALEVLLTGCGNDEVATTDPRYMAILDAPGLVRRADTRARQYFVAFHNNPEADASVAPLERNRKALLPQKLRIPGTIVSVDSNLGCAVLLIQSYTGRDWTISQELTLYSASDDSSLSVAGPFSGWIISDASAVTDGRCDEPIVVVAGSNARDHSEILRLHVPTMRLDSLAIGSWPAPSPDHRAVAFWQRQDDSFRLCIWSVGSNHVLPVVSATAADPGSGISWRWGWSDDSNAIIVDGMCLSVNESVRSDQQIRVVYIRDSGVLVELD